MTGSEARSLVEDFDLPEDPLAVMDAGGTATGPCRAYLSGCGPRRAAKVLLEPSATEGGTRCYRFPETASSRMDSSDEDPQVGSLSRKQHKGLRHAQRT